MERVDTLVFKQYYLDCLSHASYLVGDRGSGRAVVVDPQRDVGEYIADAARLNLNIERVIETHVHADFLSGHLELAAHTEALISYGSAAQVDFAAHPLPDGRKLSLGDVELEILHTPGHTPESICVVVRAHAGDKVPFGVLTGDTLFVGDVGRPDLAACADWSTEKSARALFRSTRRLLALPDATGVYPAHGSGSSCGKNLSAEHHSTIGEQRRTNHALAEMAEGDFVDLVCSEQIPAPRYFAYTSARNRQERPTLDESTHVPALSFGEFLRARSTGGVVLDTRDPDAFAAGHLADSINVPLCGRFAELAGEVLSAHSPILLVCDPGTEREARNRLARIGFDRVPGALADGAPGIEPEYRRTAVRHRVDEFVVLDSDTRVVDVRNPGEVRADGTIPGARLIPLPELPSRINELARGEAVAVFCASGRRSSIAASILRAAGFTNVSDLQGGFASYSAEHPIARPDSP
ncbi:rhodanese-like domain-containing protein [Embleya sp. NPDC127516]|uniref:rhodanese-like domain-containing protein n=1 Tax=Embleya sp. NPDC127516 TaxID=3363990 RepID=UPI0038033705